MCECVSVCVWGEVVRNTNALDPSPPPLLPLMFCHNIRTSWCCMHNKKIKICAAAQLGVLTACPWKTARCPGLLLSASEWFGLAWYCKRSSVHSIEPARMANAKGVLPCPSIASTTAACASPSPFSRFHDASSRACTLLMSRVPTALVWHTRLL